MPPASWRIVSRSSGSPKTTSVDTTKPGRRTECTWPAPTVAPRAATGPAIWSSGLPIGDGATSLSRSASSRAVPLGTSGFVALAKSMTSQAGRWRAASRAPALAIAAVREKFPDATAPRPASRAATSISA